MSKSEKQFTSEIKCGHCQNSVSMEIVASYSGVKSYSDERFDHTWDAGYVYELCKCPACEKISFRRYSWHSDLDCGDTEYENLYPHVRDLRGLPTRIETAYKAALRVRTIDANAYGVLIGRVLDLICEDRSASGKTLDQRLKSLAERGEIPTKLVDVATGLRHLRNIGAHANLGDLTEVDLPVLDDLARAILEYVYSAPLLAKDAEERLSQLKSRSDAEISA
jgi:hypothetical protein